MKVIKLNESAQDQMNELIKQFNELRAQGVKTSDYRYKDLLKKEKELKKALQIEKAEQMGAELYNKAKLTKLITSLTDLSPYKTGTSAVRGYRPVISGSFEVNKETEDTLIVTTSSIKNADIIYKALKDSGFDIKRNKDATNMFVSVFKK